MNTFVSVYIGSAVLSIISTSVIIRIGRRSSIMDTPDIRKVHSKPVPRIGGVAIFISTMSLIIPLLLLTEIGRNNIYLTGYKGLFLLSAVFLIFIVGLIDDIYGMKAKIKLFAQITASLIVCQVGIRIDSITITDTFIIHFGWFSWPVTIFWIVGLTNAINLIDGLDGLAAGICVAACGVITILTLHFKIQVMTLIMLSILGALTGFLFFNFNPAKVFMGDSGSLFLGFTIATSSIFCASKTETLVGLALPVLALGIPVFDTFFSIMRRFLERRSLFSPDRSHFHHKLLALGLHQRHAVLIAYGLTLVTVGLGMFMLVTRNVQTIIVFICILLLLVLVFRAVGAIRFREILAGLKQKYEIARQTKLEIENFEQIELYFRNAQMFEQWWQAVCFAADKMGFVRSLLPLTNRDGTQRMLTWERSNGDFGINDTLKSSLSLRDRRSGPPLNLEVQVNTNGSLESAGRRLTLFTRLLEEHSVTNLSR
ncbi:MAG: undecaprenyl/decaprenyl-phosphate alpha-N-acetylglucosaminyl 1-phosphate transferase [Sedimentisphaerales bacterium]|nr:undecaprenyl/decaprenyl-phosphate alpha-N-acetylglucosaminyl 1-phosphate transferase [Sedimentisphaerales bacterium]